jgi:DNA-binding XRE family transcriptional regulator
MLGECGFIGMHTTAVRNGYGYGKRADVSATRALAAQFARQLTALRAERHETQKQLAVRLGMTESMISRLETGNHLPSLTTLTRIAHAFDRRLQIVFHDHEHEHADGIRHTHVHGHADFDHMHDHGDPE